MTFGEGSDRGGDTGEKTRSVGSNFGGDKGQKERNGHDGEDDTKHPYQSADTRGVDGGEGGW